MNNQKEQHASASEGTSQPAGKSSEPDSVLNDHAPIRPSAVKDAKDNPGAAIRSAAKQLGNNWNALTDSHPVDDKE